MATAYPLNWELESLLPAPASPEFGDVLSRYKATLEAMGPQSESLPAVTGEATAAKTWAGFLKTYESAASLGGDLESLVGCYAAGDAGNALYRSLEARLAALQPLRTTIATNIEFTLGQASDESFRAFLKADPTLAANAFFFGDLRRLARLRLPKDQEQLAAELDVDGFAAWGRLYDRLSGELRVTVMEKGELVRKSPGQVLFDSPERSVRQNNFYAADKAWATIEETCGDCLNHLAGTRLTKYRRAGLTDHLDAPLHFNRMSRETLETMWRVVAERRGMLTKYFDAKANVLGLDKLAWYDQTAPLPAGGKPATKLPYDEACDLVLKTFHGFSPELGDFAQQALDEKWIEVENRPGKRQGGFCTGFPTAKQSRIFMTYTDSADSMSTLAHELGHAYHSHVLKDEPFFLREYPMNLAETASTFAEQVLGQERLDRASDDFERRAILDHMLSDSVAFCMNLHARFTFEDRFHRLRAEGEVSPEKFSELMLEAQKECYCNGLAEDDYNLRFWVSKLHFYITHVPFYNFPYTFGYLLSLGLYGLAKQGAKDFPRQYREFLRGTGRMTAEDAVRTAFGHDLTQPDFWQTSMDEIEHRVSKFVELA
ncbi:MAG: M3 family oligoendopeptidase [Planctomycetota bacterium]|nr:M3 family oligoendopeptidase [Planctomycetaceae bacterium]MDQ3329453.1 M3 family oligoendopeptidase [Planctomycetota bacterium]